MTRNFWGRFAIGSFLAFVPLINFFVTALSSHDIARAVQIGVGAVSAACIAAFLGRREISVSLAGLVVSLLLVTLATAAICRAIDIGTSAREAVLTLGLICIAIVVASGERQAVEFWVIVAIATATLSACLVLTNLLITIAHGGEVDRNAVLDGYAHIRFFNHVQTAMLPLLLIGTRRTFRGGEFVRLAWFAFGMQLAFLFFTLGRATGLALISASAVSLLIFRKAAISLLKNFVVGSIAGGVLCWALFSALPALAGCAVDPPRADGIGAQTYDSRMLLWKLAWSEAVRSPWFGIGPMGFARFQEQETAHPHSIYLQVAAEWGIPMALVLVALAGWGLWSMARAINACREENQADIGIGLFIAAMAVAVDGFFSGNFVMPMSQVWIAVVIGAAYSWTRLNATTATVCRPVPLPYWSKLSVGALLVASQLWLCASAWSQLPQLDEYLAHVRSDVSHRGQASPRFWSNGWF